MSRLNYVSIKIIFLGGNKVKTTNVNEDIFKAVIYRIYIKSSNNSTYTLIPLWFSHMAY